MSFIHDDIALLRTLLKIGQQAAVPPISGVDNAKNLKTLLTNLLNSYGDGTDTTTSKPQNAQQPANPAQQSAAQQPSTAQNLDAPTARELSTLLPFNYNEINFDNITAFLTQFSLFSSSVGNAANNIVKEIKFARVLMRQPGPIILLGDATTFINTANDPKNATPMVDHLKNVIQDTAALYSQCIYHLENKRIDPKTVINTRPMRQNLEVATGNMNTLTRFRYSAQQQATR